MGLDGQSTADLADPFENMRMGLYSQRMKYNNASILLPQDMLRLHTLGTAQAIGVADKVGSLEVGKFADFLLVDTDPTGHGPGVRPLRDARVRLQQFQRGYGLRGRRTGREARPASEVRCAGSCGRRQSARRGHSASQREGGVGGQPMSTEMTDWPERAMRVAVTTFRIGGCAMFVGRNLTVLCPLTARHVRDAHDSSR